MKTTAFLFFLMLVALTGCGPSDLNGCREEAAKMTTDAGVRLANQVCIEKFPRPLTAPAKE